MVAKLEADLIVALAGRAMGHRVGADFFGDFDLLLRNQGPRDRRAQEILPLIDRVGAEHRKHVIPDEFLAQVLDEDIFRLDAEQQRLLARGLELLALAEIGGEGHDLASVCGLQPLQDDRGVEPARIGEHDLLHVLAHNNPVLFSAKFRGDYRQKGLSRKRYSAGFGLTSRPRQRWVSRYSGQAKRLSAASIRSSDSRV